MDLRDLIKNKKQQRVETKVPFKDINREVVATIYGINVFGKDGRDDEVVEILLSEIGTGGSLSEMESFGRSFKNAQAKLGKDLKKGKDGLYRNEGKIYLKPKTL